MYTLGIKVFFAHTDLCIHLFIYFKWCLLSASATQNAFQNSPALEFDLEESGFENLRNTVHTFGCSFTDELTSNSETQLLLDSTQFSHAASASPPLPHPPDSTGFFRRFRGTMSLSCLYSENGGLNVRLLLERELVLTSRQFSRQTNFRLFACCDLLI